MIDPNLMVNTVKRREVALGRLESLYLVGARLLRERCVCYANRVRSTLKFLTLAELIITLGLLDYLLSFHHYTTDPELPLYFVGYLLDSPIN